ncbi:hypothetical protein BDSB_28125 [Burkholderia dolosa PC543]|nr:hypothetical protein BDSB_28125 [Burkholderia dolosa PC543]
MKIDYCVNLSRKAFPFLSYYAPQLQYTVAAFQPLKYRYFLFRMYL